MTKGIRYFLTGSAMVVVLGLGTGLVAYYNGGISSSAIKAANADLVYIPADAGAVAYADVRAIMTSEFRQKLRQVLPTGEELEKFRTELGVDIERDIDSVSAAYLGGVPAEGHGVVIVRGRFDQGRIEAMATQHGATVEDYKGKRLLTMNPSDMTGHSEPMEHPAATVAFLEGGALAMGETSAVKKAIDTSISGEDIRKNAELMGLINEVVSTGNAWVVGQVDAMDVGLPTEIKDHLPAVNMFAASVHVNGGVAGMLRADARDEKAAEQLRDVVKGAVAAGKLMTGQNAKMDAMLNSLNITGSGKTVAIRFTLPAELLEMLNGVAAARQLGTGGTGERIHK